jgi:hypothetical protein
METVTLNGHSFKDEVKVKAMQAAVLTAPGKIEVKEVALPETRCR